MSMMDTTIQSKANKGKFQESPYGIMDKDYGQEVLFQAYSQHHQEYHEESILYQQQSIIQEPDVFFASLNLKTSFHCLDTTIEQNSSHAQQSIFQHSSPQSQPFEEKSLEKDQESFNHSEVIVPQESFVSEEVNPNSTSQSSNEFKINKRKIISKKSASNHPKGWKVIVSGQKVNQNTNQLPKRKKKDQRKNMYGYSFKFIVKAFLSIQYRLFLQKLCNKYEIYNPRALQVFYSQKLAWSIALKDLRGLLDYEAHAPNSEERKMKQAFHEFYIWFMRKRYTIHVLQEEKILHKDPYIEAKNYLLYLPKLRLKPGKQSLSD